MTNQEIRAKAITLQARATILMDDLAAWSKEATQLINALGPVSAPGARKGKKAPLSEEELAKYRAHRLKGIRTI